MQRVQPRRLQHAAREPGVQRRQRVGARHVLARAHQVVPPRRGPPVLDVAVPVGCDESKGLKTVKSLL
jgi:hypothetical protein